MAGSDSGLVFVFDVATGISLALLPASEQITNAVQPHTFLPVLATSGIRHRIHIWEQNPAPTSAIPSALTPQYCKSDGGRTADRLRACPSPWLRRCPGGTVEKAALGLYPAGREEDAPVGPFSVLLFRPAGEPVVRRVPQKGHAAEPSISTSRNPPTIPRINGGAGARFRSRALRAHVQTSDKSVRASSLGSSR